MGQAGRLRGGSMAGDADDEGGAGYYAWSLPSRVFQGISE